MSQDKAPMAAMCRRFMELNKEYNASEEYGMDCYRRTAINAEQDALIEDMAQAPVVSAADAAAVLDWLLGEFRYSEISLDPDNAFGWEVHAHAMIGALRCWLQSQGAEGLRIAA